MRIASPHVRLSSLWGVIDAQHNRLISSHVIGRRVLDIGCGYGSLVEYLTSLGFSAEGWDYDHQAIDVAKRLFPRAAVRVVDAEKHREASAHAFDSVVLKDSLHHLAGDGDVHQSFRNIKRLLKPGGRIVILDPNPTWILRAARRLVSHVDPEASCVFAVRLLEEQGFEIRGVDFYETIGLPLSGGYVGLRLVPNWRPINELVASLNDALSRAANRLHLGRALCWRYLIHADLRTGVSSCI